MKLLNYLFVFIIAVSCTAKIPGKVEKNLETMGNDASAFKKLINHYQSEDRDKRKLQAVYFIINNILPHHYYTSDSLKQFDKYLEFIGEADIKERHWKWDSLGKKNIKVVYKDIRVNYDYKTITADYLIKNIDEAFSIWERSPWKDDFTFDEFCNYILPYRSDEEPIGNWRKKLSKKYSFLYDTISSGYDLDRSYTFLYKYVRDSLFLITMKCFYPFQMDIDRLLLAKSGACPDKTNFTSYVLRSFGVPVAIETLPSWGNDGRPHSFNVLPDEKLGYKYIIKTDTIPYKYPFVHASRRMENSKLLVLNEDFQDPVMSDFLKSKVIDYHLINTADLPEYLTVTPGRSVAKLFRKTYEIQSSSLMEINKSYHEKIPYFFESPNLMDVTGLYVSVQDIEIDIKNKPDHANFAYLCTSSGSSFIPVAWSLLKKNNVAEFTDVGKQVLYFTMYLYNDRFYVANNPFVLSKSGDVKYLHIDNNHPQKMILHRKYPLFSWIVYFTNRSVGGIFQGASKKDFSDAQDLYTIEKTPDFDMNKIQISNENKFRYIRFINTKSYGDMNEIEVLEESNKKLDGKILCSDDDNILGAKRAFDGDYNTRYEGKDLNSWIAIDFGTPKLIKQINFVPRSDRNGIHPGEEYELLFWDNQWKSGGRKTAKDNYLVYDSIPSNTVYWLKCHSGGTEERIFTYEDGKQIWW